MARRARRQRHRRNGAVRFVRIDFADALPSGAGGGGGGGNGGAGGRGSGSGSASVGDQLAEDCRARVPGIYFEFDSDVLNPASAPALKNVAGLLQQHQDWNVEIEGHTDNVGGPRYNQDLSERRAASVKRALVSDYSIAPTRLTPRGFGLNRPIESNDTVEGRAMNRRVELVRPCK